MTETTGPAGADKAARRREAFLRAARELFLEQGYDGVGIGAIIARAGGSKATLYAQFGNKEGLYRALMEETVREIMAPSAMPSVTEAPPREVLTRFATTLASRVLSPETMGLFRLAVAGADRFPELAATFHGLGPAAARRRLAAWLAEADRAGVLRVPDPDLACDLFMGMLLERHVVTIALGVEPPPDAEALRRKAEAVVDVFLAAYGGPPPS